MTDHEKKIVQEAMYTLLEVRTGIVHIVAKIEQMLREEVSALPDAAGHREGLKDGSEFDRMFDDDSIAAHPANS